jgi:hypothetical protein
MTHDELPYIAIIEDLNKLIRKQMKAIDAVMELHKPISSWVYDELVKNHHCSCDEWNEYDMGYPCETIQAIEKELS